MTTRDFAHINYDLIPEHMRGSLRAYIELGSPVGSFLTHVLSNDLVHAYGAAGEINAAAMRDWAAWLYNECPIPAWGSPKKVREWQEERRQRVAAATQGEAR